MNLQLITHLGKIMKTMAYPWNSIHRFDIKMVPYERQRNTFN